MPSLKITILGSGTSMGVPTLTCKCPVCLSDDPRDKRTRGGAWIRANGRSLLIDCSIDFRQQAIANQIEDVDAVLVTHTHSDHVAGLDDLRIYNMVHKKKIDFYAQPCDAREIRRRFDYCFNPAQIGGGVPDIRLIEALEPFDLYGLPIVPIPVKHGILDVHGYRIGRFAYVTDASHLCDRSIEMLGGLDTLVINALKRKPHATHFSLPQALEIVGKVRPRQAWFIHMSHDLGHAETNAQLPPSAQLAHDGLVFEVPL